MALPSGADPRIEQRAPTLEPNCVSSLVSGFRLGLAGCAGSFSGVLFSRARSCLFLFLFLLLAAGVTFQLPAGGTSGQTQGHPPKNRYWAPTQGPVLSGTPLDVRCSETLAPCIRSIKSAGTHGRLRRDGSDGCRSPVPQGDNTGGRDRLPPPPAIVSSPADRSRTS